MRVAALRPDAISEFDRLSRLNGVQVGLQTATADFVIERCVKGRDASRASQKGRPFNRHVRARVVLDLDAKVIPARLPLDGCDATSDVGQRCCGSGNGCLATESVTQPGEEKCYNRDDIGGDRRVVAWECHGDSVGSVGTSNVVGNPGAALVASGYTTDSHAANEVAA